MFAHASATLEAPLLCERFSLARDEHVGSCILDTILKSWWSWCDGECAPCWSKLDWAKHPQILPYVFLNEAIEGRYRVRLVGDIVEDHFGRDMATRYLDEVMPSENYDDVSKRLDHALESGKPNYADKTMAWKEGFGFIRYEALQLPFRSDNAQEPPKVLTVMRFEMMTR